AEALGATCFWAIRDRWAVEWSDWTILPTHSAAGGRPWRTTMAEQAFGSFTHYGESADKGSWLSSLAASSLIYVVLGLLVLSIPVTRHVIQARKPVQIKFVERVVKTPPPVDIPQPKVQEPKPLTAPPTQVITRPKAPAAAAPIVRPDQKIRRVDKPPPPKKLDVPK